MRPIKQRLGICLAALAASAGCTDSGAAPAASADEELTFEILFAGADGTADLRGRDRLAVLPQQLAQTTVDVLCLQGVGDPRDRAALKGALGRVFPFSLELPTDDNSTVDDPRDAVGQLPAAETRPPCAGFEGSLGTASVCFAGCASATDGPLADLRCVEPCWPTVVSDTDPERRCQSCMEHHLSAGEPVRASAKRCLETVHPLNLHGQHGMMLLSKHALSRPSLHVLPSEGTRRAILGATVTTPGGAQIDAFCTSLSTTQVSAMPNEPRRPSSPYTGPYGAPRDGWLRENELQVEKLAAHVSARREGRPAVVLGNFGTSAEVVRSGNVVLPSAGPLGAARLGELFESGVAPSYAPSCTICAANPIVFYGPTAESFHNRIYLAGLGSSQVRSSSRSYLGAVVAADPKAELTAVRVPLSMQYGFRSTIAVPR